MDDTLRAELENRILKEIAALEKHIHSLEGTVNPVEPDVAIGRISRLDTMLNQGINKNSLAQSKERILNLRRALQRMREDSGFGECLECGDPIPVARLLALPETEYCVHCAE